MKIELIPIASLIGMLLTATTVFAATTVDTNWNGGGSFGINFVSGDDAHSSLSTGGDLISGEFHAIDSDDNPYGYQVDSTEVKLRSHVGDGTITYTFTRDDSYEGMYGQAGQISHTYIDTYGTGDFAWRSNSNYAALGNSNYGWQSDGQMQATGDHYIYHSFNDGYGEGAEITVDANANTVITDMCESQWGSSYTFGKGCGCYTNANVHITGSGTFDLDAYADNQIVTDTGITVNGGHLNIGSDFTGGFHFNNFALTGN